ncbi:Uncharacterised protein [uncultured archaeon]|nr:Uncharacterised protein [uncultured archaeon]
MNTKLLKKNGKFYIQLPEDFSPVEEVDILRLRDDLWLLAAPARQAARKPGEEKPAKPEGKKLTSAEKSVLHKLMKIRFADRTPSNIEKTFSGPEKETVRQLIKEGFLQVFYGKKYEKTGVYNISGDIYPLLSQEDAPTGAVQQAPAQAQQQAPARSAVPPSYSELTKNGWMIIPNPRDAEQFSYDLKTSGLSSNVKGVRGFDGRFYVATNKLLYASYPKIKDVLEKKKEMHLVEIASETGMEVDAASVIMHLLAESGEIIEKKRDLYCLA